MKQIGAAMRYISHSCSILSLGNVLEVFNAKVGVSARWPFGPKSARGSIETKNRSGRTTPLYSLPIRERIKIAKTDLLYKIRKITWSHESSLCETIFIIWIQFNHCHYKNISVGCVPYYRRRIVFPFFYIYLWLLRFGRHLNQGSKDDRASDLNHISIRKI